MQIKNRKKVLFVRPPNMQQSQAWKKQGVVRCPLSLAMLAAYVREKGNYQCDLIDFEDIEPAGISQMANTIVQKNPAYVCLTALTPRFPTTVRIAGAIKSLCPDIITIVGGPHVTGLPQYSLFDGIDYAIAGEGEQALLELLNTIENGQHVGNIANLVYRQNGAVCVNPVRPFIDDLDLMPRPAWDLMNISAYKDPTYFPDSHLAIYTTRGCPYSCSFCASAVTWKRKVRYHSIENVIEQIKYIVNELGIHDIMFWDDTFAIDQDRAIEICNRICDEQLDIRYTAQFRADACTSDLVKALLKSGCSFGHIGVESGNDKMLEQIGKGETKEQFREAVKIMKSLNLPCIASYIIGLPGDTHETIQETIDFAFELDAEQSKFMILTPLPGTKVYDMAVQRGLADPNSLEQLEALNYYDSVSINLSNVSDEDLIRYQDIAYERFDNKNAQQVQTA